MWKGESGGRTTSVFGPLPSGLAHLYQYLWCLLYTALHCSTLHCSTQHCTTHCSTLQYSAVQCRAVHCTALHCTALHCTALHTILKKASPNYTYIKSKPFSMHYTTNDYTTLHSTIHNILIPLAHCVHKYTAHSGLTLWKAPHGKIDLHWEGKTLCLLWNPGQEKSGNDCVTGGGLCRLLHGGGLGPSLGNYTQKILSLLCTRIKPHS